MNSVLYNKTLSTKIRCDAILYLMKNGFEDLKEVSSGRLYTAENLLSSIMANSTENVISHGISVVREYGHDSNNTIYVYPYIITEGGIEIHTNPVNIAIGIENVASYKGVKGISDRFDEYKKMNLSDKFISIIEKYLSNSGYEEYKEKDNDV